MRAPTEIFLRSYAPCQIMPAHRHQASLMSIVTSGAFRERIDNSERHYARGHIAFFPAGRTHAQAFGPDGARQIIFRPREDWLAWLSDAGTDLDAVPCTYGPEFGLLGHRLLAELANDDGLSEMAREGILLEIVAAFGRSDSAKRTSRPAPRWLREAREFLDDNAGRSVTLGDVARAAGRHETHVAREFRRYFGTSVVGYLRRLRVQRAARMLGEDHAGISAIAFDCGYSSHSHLCREFRLFYGIAPSAYRSSRRK